MAAAAELNNYSKRHYDVENGEAQVRMKRCLRIWDMEKTKSIMAPIEYLDFPPRFPRLVENTHTRIL